MTVAVERLVPRDGRDAIYRVTNEGPVDLDSVVVYEPVLGEVEGRIRHPVARTGSDYSRTAEVGPIPMGTYGRFTLSLGVGVELPQFRVKIVSRAGEEEWAELVLLDPPRERRAARASSIRLSRGEEA